VAPVLLALAALAQACATAPVAPAQPPGPSPPREPPAATAPPPAPPTTRPPHPAAPAPPEPPRYGVEPAPTREGLEARALEAALSALSAFGGRPEASPALSLAARELATRAADGDSDPLVGPNLRSALARASAFDPAPRVVLVSASPDDLAVALASRVPRSRATHAGVGVVVRGDTAYAVLVASERAVRLDPFPRDVKPGAEVSLSGELLQPLRHARIYVTRPGGAVGETFPSGDDRAFRARIAFPVAGRYVVEVTADDGDNPEVVALLPVSAGGASLDAGVPRPAPPSADDADLARAEAAVVKAINATRRKNGLRTLDVSRALTEVARRHSQAMLQAGKVAHVLPGSGELSDRLRLGRIPYRRAYENVGRHRTAIEAHEGAEESPAHLANVLRADVRLVGVGLARGRIDLTGDYAVYLTEIFVEPTDEGAESPLTPDARVREVLWRERSRTSAPPLTADPLLDGLAREAASAMRGADSPDPGDARERALRAGRGLAAVDVFVASAPEEATRSANVRDPRFRRVGVGTATGESARFGPGRLWIAVVWSD